jgi:hypothetical protein
MKSFPSKQSCKCWIQRLIAYAVGVAIVDGCDCLGSIVLLSQEILMCDVCSIDHSVKSNPRFGWLVQIWFDC